MRAEVISIGDELTSGQRLDTNSQWLAERLGEIGVQVMFHTTVGDDLAANVRVFREAIERADVIVASGGLGPTADDLTRQALADCLGLPLVQDDAALEYIRGMFARRKREMPPANLVQAQFPQGSRAVHNPNGTAPGIDLEVPRPHQPDASARDEVGTNIPSLTRRASIARIFCLPGVPAEMKEMWSATVGPAIAAMQPEPRMIRHRRIKCFGVGESDLEAMLPDLIARNREPLVGITVSKATITLRVTASGRTPEEIEAFMQPTIDTIHQCLGDLIFGYEDDELQHAVVRMLAQRESTLATVECGTGGLVAHWLNEVPGGSNVFLAGEVNNMLVTDDQLMEAVERVRFQLNVRFVLGVGPFPQENELFHGSSTVPLVLASPSGIVQVNILYAGHPDILKARMAKSALNLLRLKMLKQGHA